MHYQLLDAEHFRAAGKLRRLRRGVPRAAARPAAARAARFVRRKPGLRGRRRSASSSCGRSTRNVNPEEFVFVMRFGGMPYEVAEANIKLISGAGTARGEVMAAAARRGHPARPGLTVSGPSRRGARRSRNAAGPLTEVFRRQERVDRRVPSLGRVTHAPHSPGPRKHRLLGRAH